MSQANTAMAPADPSGGGWALALILQILGVPGDTSQMVQALGHPRTVTAAHLLRAARAYPVKARLVATPADRLARHPMPAIAALRDGRFAVIGNVTDEGVLVLAETDERPRIVPLAAFDEIFAGRILTITKRTIAADPARRFNLGWFVTAVTKYRSVLYEVLVASFVIQLFGLATPLIFQNVIDKVLVHRGLATLEVLVAGLAIITLFDVVLSGLRTYLFTHTSNRIDVELGSRIYHHLVALPLGYFQTRRVGDSVARVREVETIRQFLTSSAVTLLIDVLFGGVFLGVMFLYSATLAWIVVGTLPLYVLISVGVTPAFRSRLEEKFERGAENHAFLVESITGIETIKAMAVEPLMHRRWEEQCAAYVGASFKAANVGTVATQAVAFVSKATNVLTLFVGAGLVVRNALTVGELVAFNMLANQVSGPVLRLAQVWQDFHQVKISVARLGDILNTPVEPQQNGAQVGTVLKGDIAFEGLTFRYTPAAQPVLRNVDLKIRAGEFIGIVGPSGSGKSTIAKLIQRLYLPESGRVLIDGYDAALIDTAWLRRQIGVVLQENILFNASVRDNIALADPGMSLERIIRAAELAGAHEFIARLPRGYETPIGERGLSLSGGQRQRLAIARALVTDPRVLIFDEATSALDYESESIIQENMRRIVEGRTVIVIAHRLSTVRAADRILTIENGTIVEDGGHDELLLRDGRYAMLHRLQAAMR